MKAILIELKPYDPVASARVTLRICNANNPLVTLVSGGPGEFLPVLHSGPVISRSIFDGAFSGSGSANESRIGVSLDEGSIDTWMGYIWADADVTIWVGEEGAAFGSYTKLWTVAAEAIKRGSGVMAQIDLRAPARLNRPILFQSFAGTDDGDAGDVGEGRAAVAGVLKPWCSGNARYVPAVLIDAARQIYCYHGYGPTIGATEQFEGGVSNGAPDFTWANYTAMRDAVLTSSQWGHCPSIGMCRLGGQPSFPVTFHVSGDAPSGTLLTKTADVIKRFLEGPGGMTAPAIPATNVTALNTSRPEAIDLYIDSAMSVETAITELMVAANGYWIENEAGQIILGLIAPGLAGAAPTTELNLDGQASPIVKRHSEEAAGVPVYRSRVGGRQTHGPHSPNDIPASIVAIQTTADAATYTYPPSAIAPVAGPVPTVGDIWPDNSTGVTIMRRYTGATWERVTDIGSNVTLGPLGSMSAVDIIGNSFKRTAAGTDWSYAVVANQVLSGSAYARMGSVASGWTFVALDDDNATTARASQKYYFQVNSNGSWNVHTNSDTALASGTASAPPAGSNIEVRYGGTKVEFIIGTTVVHTITSAAANQSLYAKFWAYQVGTYSQIAAGYSASNVDPVISLTSDAQGFKFVDNVASPASQTITLTAIKQNTSETIIWTTSPVVTLGGSGDVRTLTDVNFGLNRQVVITATGATTGVKDTMTVMRLDATSGDALAFVPRKTWLFETAGNVEGFTANAADLTIVSNGSGGNALYMGNQTTDPFLISPAVSFPGKSHYIVRARIKSASPGIAWDGNLYWSNSGHGQSGDYRHAAPQPVGWGDGLWCVAEWDLRAPSFGGQDYINSASNTQIRLDFNTVPDGTTIDWIAVGEVAIDPLLARGVDDNATRNDDGANMIPSPIALDRVLLIGSAVVNDVGGGAGRQISFGKNVHLPSNGSYVVWEGGTTTMPATPGERLFASVAYAQFGTAITTDSLETRLQCLDINGTPISGGDSAIAGMTLTGSQVSGIVTANGSAITVAGTAYVRIYTNRIFAASAGTFYVSEVFLGRHERGADQTLSIAAPTASTVFKYDAGGTAEAGQFNRDFLFKLMGQNGEITSGVTWDYEVMSGNVSGSGVGVNGTLATNVGSYTLPVSSLGSIENIIKITATYRGKATSFPLKLTKDIAVPAGGVLADKTSGFAGYTTTTDVDQTGTMTATLFAGKTAAVITVQLDGMPNSGTTGGWNTRLAVQRFIGGVWTDIYVPSNQPSDWSAVDVSGSAASFGFSYSDTGLTGGTSYSWRVVMRLAANTRGHAVTGRVTITA